jgi:hypothetical protein
MDSIHHLEIAVTRLYIKRWNGERGSVQLGCAYGAAVIGLIG